jgi:ribosomal protein S1
MSDKKEGGHSRAAKTITGTVLRVEGDHVFIEGKNGKEMRVHVDKTTQMGNNIERGEPVEAMVNDQHHALSILSGPAVTDRRNDKE